MTEKLSKYPVYLGVKLTPDQDEALRRAAAEDDRTPSQYVRHLIARDLRERGPQHDETPEEATAHR